MIWYDLRIFSICFQVLLGVWILFSEQEVEHLAVTKNVQDIVERVLNSRPMIDDFLKHNAMSQEPKVGEMALSDSSSKNEVKETSERRIIVLIQRWKLCKAVMMWKIRKRRERRRIRAKVKRNDPQLLWVQFQIFEYLYTWLISFLQTFTLMKCRSNNKNNMMKPRL